MVDESRAARGAARPQHGESGRNARARVRIAVLVALSLSACGTARGAAEFEPPRPREPLRAGPGAFTTLPPAAGLGPLTTVSGDIRFLSPPGDLDLGRVVVFLATRSRADRASSGGSPIPIVSEGQTFAPPLVAVPWNRPVVLANEGPVNHRLFATDLGVERSFRLGPGGRSDPFRLPPAGPIRFFCSLHAAETFVVFSARTAHVAVVEPRERFSFGPVAPGRYVLSIWSERVEGPVREVLVNGYTHRVEPVWIDPGLVRPADAAPRSRR